MPPSSILREIAKLSNPSGLDYDPEGILPDYEDSDSEASGDIQAGREHFLEVR